MNKAEIVFEKMALSPGLIARAAEKVLPKAIANPNKAAQATKIISANLKNKGVEKPFRKALETVGNALK